MKKHTLTAALGAVLALSMSTAALAAKPDPNRVLVKFKPGTAAGVEAALKGAGGKVHLRLQRQNTIAVTVPEQALAGLRNNPNIVLIERDQPKYPSGQVTPYGINNVQAPDTVATGADGSGIKVCVIDSGINAGHEEFAGIAMSGYPSGWDNDTCGHGTHVAGTIAAADNGTGVIGVSPARVSLHIVKVFDGAACGWSYSSTLVDAAYRCADAGAKVINMSLGGGASQTEENAFNDLQGQGVLSIAAAGNDGNSADSYPASYDSVMSVAAVDSANVVADFSQFNDQVEIAGPGVGVLSTVPFIDGQLVVGTESFIAAAITGSVQATASGAMVDGGLCDSAGNWAGQVVMCERGAISFAAKVDNITAGGGAAAVIYNNVSGGFAGTLGDGVTSTIPAISLSQEDGQALVAGSLGQGADVSTLLVSDASGYGYKSGTSMATPHVAGVAALVWSANPSASNSAVRNALTSTALDLGAAGRDVYYGHGLVQAFDATEALLGGGGGGSEPPTDLTGYSYGFDKGKLQVGLTWSSGAVTVDVYRDGSRIASAISNAGGYNDAVKVRRNSSGTLSYKVCNAGGSSCSGTVSVAY